VNIPSTGLRGQQVYDELEEAGLDDSLDLFITESDYSTQLSDSQRCTVHTNTCIACYTHTVTHCYRWPYSSDGSIVKFHIDFD